MREYAADETVGEESRDDGWWDWASIRGTKRDLEEPKGT